MRIFSYIADLDNIDVEKITGTVVSHIKPEFIADESKVEESVHGEASITMDQFNPEQLVQHCKEEEEASSVTINGLNVSTITANS